MKAVKKNLNKLSKQLTKSVKSHAESATTLDEESKRIAKASKMHSKQVKTLKKLEDKTASYTNLTKLANAMNQQSEQGKNPSKATYLPALAGLTVGGGLAYSGQKRVSKSSDLLRGAEKAYSDTFDQFKKLNLEAKTRGIDLSKLLKEQDQVSQSLEMFRKVNPDGTLSEYYDAIDPTNTFKMNIFRKRTAKAERIGKKILALRSEEFLSNAERRKLSDAVKAGEQSVKKHTKLLDKTKDLRKRDIGVGVGLVGLGVGTTALLRKRKKRKQEQAKLANAMNQQSEQGKNPSKATYIPAVAGLAASVPLVQTSIKSHKQYRGVVNKLKAGKSTLAEVNPLIAAQLKEPTIPREEFAELLRRRESAKRDINYAQNRGLNFWKKDRNKSIAYGLGLVGLGVGTTALLRRRKKREQKG